MLRVHCNEKIITDKMKMHLVECVVCYFNHVIMLSGLCGNCSGEEGALVLTRSFNL